jgi:hypothetical protein
MDKHQKADICKAISDITDEARKPLKPPTGIFGPYDTEGANFILDTSNIFKYKKLIENLFENHWESKFSENYIEEKVQNIIGKLLQDGDSTRVSDYLDELIVEYDNFVDQQIVYVPLDGIVMTDVNSLNLGNVTLINMNPTQIEVIAQNHKRIEEDLEDGKKFIHFDPFYFYKGLEGLVCAEFVVVAQQQRAVERAEEETRKIINLLQYVANHISPPFMFGKVTVALQREIIAGNRTFPMISAYRPHNYNFLKYIGPIKPFTLSNETVSYMKILHIPDIANLYKSTSVSDFEKTILRSLNWFAIAHNQIESKNAFLNLVICLETILKPRHQTGNSITEDISNGVAVLLGSTQSSCEQYKKRAKDIYGTRSGISHGGEKKVSLAKLNELHYIVQNVIEKIIEKRGTFSTQEELTDWIQIEKAKYGL